MTDAYDIRQLEIALSMSKGMRAPVVRELLDRVGDLRQLFSISQAELHNLTGLNTSFFSDTNRESLIKAAASEYEFVQKNHIDTFFVDSETYPTRLANCDDAPVLLYKMGSCHLDSKHVVGIVGTRHATHYGVDFTEKLVSALAQRLDDLVIVSGLAYGIDVTAHKAAIYAEVPTVGVLAHGLNMIYPADHRAIAARMVSNGGALITEYSTQSATHRSNFLERNRIVAGICDCIVVVESDFRGGSMSTARIASQYNRDVFAVPGRVNDKYSHGTNQLIKNNVAQMITDADDLIKLMMWEADEKMQDQAPALFRALTDDEQALLDFLKDNPDATVNDICVRMGRPYALISNMLLQLEMDDIIITLPGGRYALAT